MADRLAVELVLLVIGFASGWLWAWMWRKD